MKISDEVANVLANSKVDGNLLYLPDYQLERKLYVSVNKVLEAIHGKWNRKARAHVFEEPPAETIDAILLTGEYTEKKKEFQFFETPEALAWELVKMADIQEGETVLEPSAGRGRIAGLIKDCDCVELEPSNRRYLAENGYKLVGDDFLSLDMPYDVIVANPPFSKQQDIDHVVHMIRLARRRVVSIVSASVLFRDNKKTTAFRELIEYLGGSIISLPEETFVESGTRVRTCVVSADICKT